MLLQAWLSEELLSPKSCFFGVYSLALVFFRGLQFLGTATVKRIWSIRFFVRVIYFTQKATWSRSFYKVACRFIWEEKLWPAIHSYKRTGFSHPYLHVGWFISRNSCSHPFFQGLYGTDNFWQQLLIRIATFFGRAILGIRYF